MKKEMFFGISFYFAVCAFCGDSFRGRALPRDAFCGDLQMLRARTGYGRIV